MDVLSRELFEQPPIPSDCARRRRPRPFGRSPIADIKLALHPKGVPQWMDGGESNRSAHLPSFRNQGATLIYDLPLPHPWPALLCFAVPLGRHANRRNDDGAIYTAEFGVHHLIPGESLSLSLFYEDNGFHFSREHHRIEITVVGILV